MTQSVKQIVQTLQLPREYVSQSQKVHAKMIRKQYLWIFQRLYLENRVRIPKVRKNRKHRQHHALYRYELRKIVPCPKYRRVGIRPLQQHPVDKTSMRCRLDFNVVSAVRLVPHENIKYQLPVNRELLDIKRIKHRRFPNRRVSAINQHGVQKVPLDRFILRC